MKIWLHYYDIPIAKLDTFFRKTNFLGNFLLLKTLMEQNLSRFMMCNYKNRTFAKISAKKASKNLSVTEISVTL